MTKFDTHRTAQRQALAEASSTATSEGFEPLLVAKETKNKSTKNRGKRDGIIDGWMMLLKRFSEKILIHILIRTRNQTSDEDYMLYLDALEGLRSQCFPNK